MPQWRSLRGAKLVADYPLPSRSAVHSQYAYSDLSTICVREKHLILLLHHNHGWAPQAQFSTLGAVLEPSWAVLEACWVILAALVAFRGRLGSFWRAPGRRNGRPGTPKSRADSRSSTRRAGGVGPLEDYKNFTRQHLAFFHASTCQGARWRILRQFRPSRIRSNGA